MSFDRSTPIQVAIEAKGVVRKLASFGPFLIVIVNSALGQGSHTVPASSWLHEVYCSLVFWVAGERRCEREEASSMDGEVSRFGILSV